MLCLQRVALNPDRAPASLPLPHHQRRPRGAGSCFDPISVVALDGRFAPKFRSFNATVIDLGKRTAVRLFEARALGFMCALNTRLGNATCVIDCIELE
jgi:hypothetical protein